MFRMFSALCIAIGLTSIVSAQDWQLHPPSTNPMRFGYATGTYTNPEIRQGGILKKWLNVNDRHTYIEPVPVSGQNWGSLDNRTTLLNTRQRMVSFGGGMAFTSSSLRVNWDYIAPGQTKNRPIIELVWDIENKCSAPIVNPVINARGTGAVAGSVSQTIARINGDPDTNYNGLFRIQMKSDYTDATEEATTSPARYGYMEFKAGQSFIKATFNPVTKKYDVHRKTRRSDGTFYEKNYVVALPMNFTFSCYPQSGQSTWGGQTYQVITYVATVGRSGYPQGNPGWEDLDTDCTSMDSNAYSPGVTGDQVRDEKWSGSIKITPSFDIKHP